MSGKATGYAKDVTVCPNGKRITRTEKLLLMVMADNHSTHTPAVFVSQRKLAIEALLSVRHLRRCLESLEEKGVIKTETGLGRGNLSGYSFCSLVTAKEDATSAFNEKEVNLKSGHPETKKGTFQCVKEDTPRQTLSKVVEPKSGTEKVEPLIPTFSPQPGEGSTKTFQTNFGFHDYISGFPKHRVTEKTKREARRVWNEITHDQQQAAVARLAEWRNSAEWLKENGFYVPNPAKFLTDDRYQVCAPQRTYPGQCEKVRSHFTEVTGQANGFNKMSSERLNMLSQRFDEAVAMAPRGVDPQENALDLMFDAIDAYCASDYCQRHPDRMSLEGTFSTTEVFEKWAKREV